MANSPKDNLVITRVFDAPVELIWKAWSESEQLMRWTGPYNYTIPFYNTDFRVDGKFHLCMRSPEGQNIYGAGTYKEIIPLEKIVYTDSFADENGAIISASAYGMNNFPLEMKVTVIFEEENGKTKMTLEHAGIPQGEDREQAKIGWNESFDKLEDSLKIKEGK